MRVSKKILAASATGVMLVALAGCGRGGSDQRATTDKARVALVTRDLTNAYWVAWDKGAKAAFAKRGVTGTVAVGDSETDIQGMSNNLSTLANQNWDCIGVVPINDSNVITPLVAAAKRGIHVIDIDALIDPKAAKAAGLDVATYIGSDNEKAGTLAGDRMATILGGTGKVAMLLGTPGEHNSTLRQQGFRAAVKGKLQIVQQVSANFERAAAQTATEAILRAHRDLTGIFAANDEMGLGALRAVTTAGLADKVKVISVDGIQEALESVRDGGLAATVIQYPYVMSGMAVDACIALKNGHHLPSYVPAPISLITKDNAQKQIDAYPKPLQKVANPFKDMLEPVK
jgi:ribose transport system substrate-binding protein